MKVKISKLVTATIATFLVTALSVSAAFADVTWDPSKTSGNNVVLSDNNLTAKTSGVRTNVLATEGKSSGKWYWEIDCSGTSSNMVGIAYSSYGLSESFIGSTNDSFGYWVTGVLYGNEKTTQYGESYGSGDTIGIAIDMDSRTIRFFKNGIDQGISTEKILEGTAYAAVSTGSGHGVDYAKAKFKASQFKYPVPQGYLPYDNSEAPIVKDETITIDSPINEIEIGKEFTTDVVLHNGVNVCAEDVVINYDKNLFEYLGFEEAAGFKVYKEMPADGSVRFITASKGKENAINGDMTFVKLKFRAKQEGTGKVDAMTARIADNGTIEKDLNVDLCGEKVIKVTGIKDVNRTGKFTLLDLGIDAWYYGMKADETDNSKYDCDVVVDSNIDDLDLSSIVTAMLANTEYKPHQ